jgi:hypothetical protein
MHYPGIEPSTFGVATIGLKTHCFSVKFTDKTLLYPKITFWIQNKSNFSDQHSRHVSD